MSEVKDRLIQFIRHLGIGQLKFEQTANLSRGFVNKVGYGLSMKSEERISETYPELNMVWLKTGVGNMLSVSDDGENSLKVPGLQSESLPQDDDQDATNWVYLLPVSAQGGSLNDFVMSIQDWDCEKIISPIQGAEYAITISGDSMAPEYPNGCKVLIKKINERAFIDWGKAYVLDTCNGVVMKILVPSDKKNYVKCLSLNPDPKFAPFEVSYDNIFGIYRVLLCMATK